MPDGISPEIAEQIAELAIREYKRAEERSRKERHDRNLRNTKKLMRIYPQLCAHSDSSIAELSDVCDDDALKILVDIMRGKGDTEVNVESVRRSRARTRLMIDHINAMLEVYRQEVMRSKKDEVQRSYRVLCAMYLDEEHKDADEIAELENIDRRTVYKDLDRACERLSYYIFGVDAF